MATSKDITKKPTVKQTNVASPVRGTWNKTTKQWKATWKVPKSATDSNRDDRYEQQGLQWWVVERWKSAYTKAEITALKKEIKNNKGKTAADRKKKESQQAIVTQWNQATKKGSKVKKPQKTRTQETHIWGGYLGTGTVEHTLTKALGFDRTKYYPCTYTKTTKTKDKTTGKTKTTKKTVTGHYLNSVKVRIWGHNRHGDGPDTPKILEFSKPAQPTVKFDHDEENNQIKITLTSKDSAKAERYDVEYKITRKDLYTLVDRYSGKNGAVALSTSGGELSGVISHDYLMGHDGKRTFTHNLLVSEMPYNGSITITVKARARGLAGPSSWTTKTYTIKPPTASAITKIMVQGNVMAMKPGESVDEYDITKTDRGSTVFVFYKETGHQSAKIAAQDDTVYTLERAVCDESWSLKQVDVSANWTTNIDTNGAATSSLKSASSKNKKAYAKLVGVDDAVMGEPVRDVFAAMTQRASGLFYGERVWYRLKAERQGQVRYSAPFEATQFHRDTPTMANDHAGFMQIATGKDKLLDAAHQSVNGSIDFAVGWDNPDVTDEMYDKYKNNAKAKFDTEVSWATDSRAWTSNNKPSTMTIDWESDSAEHKEDKQDSISDVAWKKSARASILGLEFGTPYFLKVRRHVSMDEIDEYGPYDIPRSDYYPFTPVDDPTTVVVNTPEYIIEGDPLDLSWIHDAAAKQKSWGVLIGYDDLTTMNAVETPYADDLNPARSGYYELSNGEYVYTEDATPNTSKTYYLPERSVRIYEGNGTPAGSPVMSDTTEDSSTSIPWETLFKAAEANGIDVYDIDQINVAVTVSTGGTGVRSDVNLDGVVESNAASDYNSANPAVVRIVKSPECTIYCPSTVTAQPFEMYVFTNDIDTIGVVSVMAKNSYTMAYPDRDVVQSEGEYVFTYATNAQWTAVSELTDTDVLAAAADMTHYAIVKSETQLNLYDGNEYLVTAHTENLEFDYLQSDEVGAEFTVEYAHQAMVPSEYSIIESYYAKDGVWPYVEITPRPPENYLPDDVCDIYRVTPDGATRVATDVPFGSTVTDLYPPFSKVAALRYCLVTRTSDGDIAWREVAYNVRRHGLRFDWGNNRYIELPYNIELSDSFEKNVDVRAHLDGSIAAVYNSDVQRTGDYRSTLIKLESPEQFELVREMAQYPGTILVRAHDGVCYEADVQVGDLPNSYEDLVSDVSISTHEVTNTGRFDISLDSIVETSIETEETIEDETYPADVDTEDSTEPEPD